MDKQKIFVVDDKDMIGKICNVTKTKETSCSCFYDNANNVQ